MFGMHPNTQSLIKRLEKVEPSKVVTYEELAAVNAQDVRPQTAGYGYLCTARRWMENNKQVTFDVINGVGLTRPTSQEVVRLLEKRRKRVNRFCRRTLVKSTCLDDAQLAAEDRVSLHTQQAMAGAVEFMTRKKQHDAIKSKCEETSSRLSVEATIEHFKSKRATE